LLGVFLLGMVGCDRFSPKDSQGDSRPGESSPSIDTGPIDEDTPVVVITDGANQRYLYVRMDTGDVILEVDLTEHFPEICRQGFACTAFGAQPMLDEETGTDRLLLIVSVVVDGGGGHPDTGAFVAMMAITEGGVGVEWLLTNLDFSTNYADRPDICSSSTCEPPDPDGEGGVDAWQECTFSHAHVAKIIEEDETSVSLWLADTGQPARALRVTLDKNQQCGVVDEVLGEINNQDWVDPGGPNDLDVVEIDGQQHLLLTHLNSVGTDGEGMVTLWRDDGEEWTQLWQHPPGSGRLAGAHNTDLFEGSDGQLYGVYAHGNGLGASGDINKYHDKNDHRGSLGIFRVDVGGPEYIMDVAVSDPGFGFLRDADRLSDGSFLVTDSGPINHMFESCDRPPGIWHVAVDVESYGPSGKSGAFASDRSSQEVVSVEPVDQYWSSPLACGLLTPYESDWVAVEDMGPGLRQAFRNPVGNCQDGASLRPSLAPATPAAHREPRP